MILQHLRQSAQLCRLPQHVPLSVLHSVNGPWKVCVVHSLCSDLVNNILLFSLNCPHIGSQLGDAVTYPFRAKWHCLLMVHYSSKVFSPLCTSLPSVCCMCLVLKWKMFLLPRFTVFGPSYWSLRPSALTHCMLLHTQKSHSGRLLEWGLQWIWQVDSLQLDLNIQSRLDLEYTLLGRVGAGLSKGTIIMGEKIIVE